MGNRSVVIRSMVSTCMTVKEYFKVIFGSNGYSLKVEVVTKVCVKFHIISCKKVHFLYVNF